MSASKEGGEESDSNVKWDSTSLKRELTIEFKEAEKPVEDGFAFALRYRPPFQRIAKCDKKGDALQIVVDNLTQRKISLETANVVAFSYISSNKEAFELDDEFKFVEGKEQNLVEGAAWAKKILDGIPDYCRKIIKGDVVIENPPPRWNRVSLSCDTDRGRRKQQEDRMLCLPTLQMHAPDVKRPDLPLLAVLDGHGGGSIAAYSAAHLPFEMVCALEKYPDDIEKALEETMTTMNSRIAARCEVEPWQSVGSTAVVAVFDDKQIAIRWLGDSPGFIMSSTCVAQITKSHVPRDESEAARVKADGGDLLYILGELRVNGVLNLTRALGDLAGRPMISGNSDGLLIDRCADQYLLMLMCDGISDMYTTHQLYQMVEAFVHDNDVEDYGQLADFMVNTAIDGGSGDNCTCVVAFLRPPKELWALFSQNDSDDSEEERTTTDRPKV